LAERALAPSALSGGQFSRVVDIKNPPKAPVAPSGEVTHDLVWSASIAQTLVPERNQAGPAL
jgi:hypothetical protein